MNQALDTRRADAKRSGNRALFLSRRFFVMASCLGALALSGCGGGSSETPNFSQRNTYAGTYTISINRAVDGVAINSTLPSGTGTLTVDEDNTLTANIAVTDTSRSAKTRAVTTQGTITGTLEGDGSFDLSGGVREFNDRDGSITTGAALQVQGTLPQGSASSTATVTVGFKTTSGTIRFQSSTPTPSPSASPL